MPDADLIPPTPNPQISPPQVVSVVGWLLASTMIVATGTRLATKISLKRLLGIDDYLIITATLIGIGQMVATFIQARLATELLPDTISPISSEWATFEKAFYSSQLLFIPTICLAKLSVLHSLHQITPVAEHKTTIVVFGAFVSLMLLAFEFSAAFQCAGLRWNILSGQCFNQTPFWQTFSIFDIVTDALIVAFPLYVVSRLQLDLGLKTVVAGVFATRITAVVASACRLVYLTKSHGTPVIDSYAFWIYILNTEIEQGLSVITACVPFLKPFFESLETGMLAPSHGLTSVVGGSASGSGNRSKKSQLSNNSYKLKSNIDHGISVSRRISTHSEDHEGLIKEDATTTWVRPIPPHQI